MFLANPLFLNVLRNWDGFRQQLSYRFEPNPRLPWHDPLGRLIFNGPATIAALLLIPQVSLPAQPPLAIRNVTVIDGTGAPPRPHQTVLLAGNRIARVGAAATVVLPAGTRVLEGTGQTLLPGFIDMHAHPVIGPVSIDATTSPPTLKVGPDPTGARDALQVLLAFGITTIHNPAGNTEAAVALRDSVRLGFFPGPRIFTAGSAIDATRAPGMVATVTNSDEVRAEVARQAAWVSTMSSSTPPSRPTRFAPVSMRRTGGASGRSPISLVPVGPTRPMRGSTASCTSRRAHRSSFLPRSAPRSWLGSAGPSSCSNGSTPWTLPPRRSRP